MPQRSHQLSRHLGALLLTTLVVTTRLEAADACVPMPVTQGRAAAPDDRPFSHDRVAVATLNIAGNPRIVDALVDWTRERAFDVLLLQEVGSGSHDGAVFAATLSARLGYHFAYAPAQLLGKSETQGLAIVSRHRLSDVRTYPLTYHRLRFRSRCRIGLAATLDTDHGPLRVVNVHLDTRINSRDRLAQLEPLLAALGAVEAPQIIGGDFNTMNIRWFRTMWPLLLGERQTTAVRTRLAEHGFQTPSAGGPPTIKFFGLPFRLDWIYLKGIEALDWNVDDVGFTDHRGVWAAVDSQSFARAGP
jgi:endonuclease/exonuclease/phosphatase family metal-dependent hydrolase